MATTSTDLLKKKPNNKPELCVSAVWPMWNNWTLDEIADYFGVTVRELREFAKTKHMPPIKYARQKKREEKNPTKEEIEAMTAELREKRHEQEEARRNSARTAPVDIKQYVYDGRKVCFTEI